jgi:hypothetical protein
MSTTSGPKGALLGTTYLAGAAVVQYRAVKRGADSDHCVPATAASVNLGIAMDNQDNVDKSVPVAHRSGEMVTAEVGAAVALDALLTSDANGRLVTAATGNPVTAIAREVATATNQLINVELVGSRVIAP